MREITIKIVGVLIFGLLSGCYSPKPSDTKEQNSVFVIWKSPTIRYADQGFLYRAKSKTHLEIYSSGQPVMRLAVSKKQICTKDGCLSPESFNSRYLSASYPSTLIFNILSFKPIFNAQGKQKSAKGWFQKIKKEGAYAISYKVSKDLVSFHDTINNIVIKIKKEK